MSRSVIVIINGKSNDNYLQTTFKKRKVSLINLVTFSTNDSSQLKDIENAEIEKNSSYDHTITVQSDTTKIFEALKLLFQKKDYVLIEVIASQQADIELADEIRENFSSNLFNGSDFRSLISDKSTAINQLNQELQTPVTLQVTSIEALPQTVNSQPFPFVVRIIKQQQTLANYLITNNTDSSYVMQLLKTNSDQSTEFFIQPYHENLFLVQAVTINNKTQLIAIWNEKHVIKETKIIKETSELISIEDDPVVSFNQLTILCQQLTDGLQLKQGISEFLVAKTNNSNQWVLVDFNLSLPNTHQLEVMEQIIGYSSLSYYYNPKELNLEQLTKQKVKHLLIANVALAGKAEILKVTMLPTYYRYYPSKSSLETETTLSDESSFIGELYLAHTDKNLVRISYAAIKNIETTLASTQFASHSAVNIVNFYREAAMNKRTDYSKQEETTETDSFEEKEAISFLSHESQHIPKYVKPLTDKASIQDIMHYYIDIYDLYVLHGKAPGTKITPANTGNPAFLPFEPIVKALQSSFQNDLMTYARYIMQKPTQNFVDKLTQYCLEEQILTTPQTLGTNNVVIGHGSTNLYYLALKSIIKNKGDIVLITRPTYGLFIDPIYTAGGDVGFIDIKESSGWKVVPQNLDETIQFYNQKAFNNYILNIFIKDYKKLLHAVKIFNLDTSKLPSMPNILGLKDIHTFDNYIQQLNEYINGISDEIFNKEELKFSVPPRVRAFYHMNPHNPTGAVYTKEDIQAIANVIQTYPDMYVIDDLAHWGVLYGSVEPTTFLGLNQMFERTITLLSLSKSYCVPGLRAGIAIANSEVADEMQYRLLNATASATLPAILALDTVISTSKKERDEYLKSNAEAYFFRRNLMATLINGIHKTELTFAQKIKIYQLILENEYKEDKPFDIKLLQLLLSGMPLVRTLTKPSGCFFHLLDISKLIGAKIANTTITTSTDVRNAIFSLCNIDSVPGEISGNFFNYSLRLSFSLLPEQIYSVCKKIHLFIGNFIIKPNAVFFEDKLEVETTVNKLQDNIIDEVIFNKAKIRFYLSQAIHNVSNKHTQLFTEDYLRNRSRSQKSALRISELSELQEKLLDDSPDNNIHQEIDAYISKNETWLNKFLPSLNELKQTNFLFLNTSFIQNEIKP